MSAGTAADDDAILTGDWVGVSISSGDEFLPTHWFIVNPQNMRRDAIDTGHGRDTSVRLRWRSAVAF